MNSNNMDFTNKVCVVTGAASGIGREIAWAFAAAGAQVVAVDRDAAQLSQLEQDAACAERVLQIRGAVCDVADAEQITRTCDAVIAQNGRCDVLVSNAGVLRRGSLEELPDAQWEQVLDINLSGGFRFARQLARSMIAHGGGAIVHIASIAATQTHGGCGAYSASKAATVALSAQMAVEWGPHGVRSNCISPGLIETALSAPFYAVPGVREQREQLVPMRAIGKPRHVADAALFLASEAAAYINGHNLVIDGGLSHALIGQVPRPPAA
jgi:NAD(P)-dependent dehydrogenase (short-subunit alcohol dehydrogenase family)